MSRTLDAAAWAPDTTYRVAGAANATALSAATAARDLLTAFPLRVERKCTLREVGIVPRTGYSGVDQPFRIGLYFGPSLVTGRFDTDSGVMSPPTHALAAETATLYLTTTGVMVSEDLEYSLAGGNLYWLAVVFGGAVDPNVWKIQREGTLPTFGMSTSLASASVMTLVHAFGALPDPFSASTTVANAAQPAIFYRLSGID